MDGEAAFWSPARTMATVLSHVKTISLMIDMESGLHRRTEKQLRARTTGHILKSHHPASGNEEGENPQGCCFINAIMISPQ